MKIRSLSWVLAGSLFLALAGCASLPPGLSGGYSTSADAYHVGQAQQAQQVRFGTVLDVRRVTIAPDNGTKTGGSIIGVALGALAGRQIGDGNGRKVATVAGAIAGAVGGNKVVSSTYRQPGLAVTVRLDSGQSIAVTQAADVALAAGQRVQVIGGGYRVPVRVVPLHAGHGGS